MHTLVPASEAGSNKESIAAAACLEPETKIKLERNEPGKELDYYTITDNTTAVRPIQESWSFTTTTTRQASSGNQVEMEIYLHANFVSRVCSPISAIDGSTASN